MRRACHRLPVPSCGSLFWAITRRTPLPPRGNSWTRKGCEAVHDTACRTLWLLVLPATHVKCAAWQCQLAGAGPRASVNCCTCVLTACRAGYTCLKVSWLSKLQWSSELQDYQHIILKDVPRTSKEHWYFKLPTTEQVVYNILMTLVEYDGQLGEELCVGCVGVRVCVWVCAGVCVCICVGVRLCGCVCVRVYTWQPCHAAFPQGMCRA